ncbi:MAG: winged helix-turn-helix transcriptional regulator [Armatimonadetes bacterium]|nr:winged helix-turn-helix transcriptional regulator [Armatimonadota bacterium]
MLEDIVGLGSALSHPLRARITFCVRRDELCLCELFGAFPDVPQNTIRDHVSILAKAGVLDKRKGTKWMFYRISDRARPLIDALFDEFAVNVEWDPQLSKDLASLQKRLEQRPLSPCE